MKLGYQFNYLYCAIDVERGRLYSYFLPDMSKSTFQIFMQEFAQDYQLDNTLMFMDGAAAHRSYLELPKGLQTYVIPPYSPELNPVERFFQELRKATANRIYDSISDIEHLIQNQIMHYNAYPDSIIQLTHYPYFNPNP